MNELLIPVLAVIIAAMVFDYTNGFHDAANAIATSVSTRALTPRIALGIAALGNFVGAHFGAQVAKTVGSGIITPPEGEVGLGIVFAGVVGAIAWNLLTWYYGIPSSSSHALIGGLVGAMLAALAFGVKGEVLWGGILEKVVLPMIVSPATGFILGAAFMLFLLWAVYLLAKWLSKRKSGRLLQPTPLNRFFRFMQSLSAIAMSVGHGMQDAAKTMGIIVLALYTGGFQSSNETIPEWVFWTSATVLALGTYAGGWRIIRTLGRRVIHLDPMAGFAAETVASSVLFTAAAYGLPISTTHTITSAIMGVGATKKFSAVRWGVAGNIMTAWVLTFPGAAIAALITYVLVRPIF
ncbi:low-affinity phosphate transporter PitH [Catellatospora chokoriensis]|uniref:Inorganic phosphate transporter n=2 Tax=Catellatospora chokoriensis TaxID=310353 RepID=A0A8J3K459_9ACTN|nr:inorganic phosphate transporter [Catellatospora chokoriensis]GIF92092.1 inorganic phosphate transporter [Catellatospora chokoriensis]